MTHHPESPLASETAWVDADPPGVVAIASRVARLGTVLWGQRALLGTFVARDVQARLTGTLLGRLWPVVHPLALFLAYYVLFTRVLGVRLPAGSESNGSLAAYMFVGVLSWTALAEALTRSAFAITDHAELVRKISFPSEILPAKCVLVAAVAQLLGVFAFVVARAVAGAGADALAQLYVLPLVLAEQLALAFGLGLVVAAAQVLVRDTAHVLALALTLAMLATPVFWIADPVALPALAPYASWIDANPFHHLLVGWRCALAVELGPADPARSLAIVAAWAAGAVACGAALFALAQRRFADEV